MSEPVRHTLDPYYQSDSRILILGTMPSPKSREEGFYYAHPQNRFWPVLSQVLGEPLPRTREEKCALLSRRRIALWDVLSRCDIQGADDGSIRNPQPNDLRPLLARSDIHGIFTTGCAAARLYQKLCLPLTRIPAIGLPSTSPANCRYHTYESLVKAYSVILEYL